MKQIISKLLSRVAAVAAVALLTAATAWADSVTWSGTTALPGSFTSIGSSPIQIKTSSTNSYTDPIRVYANTTITIQATDGYVINSVTYEAYSTGNYVTYAKEATVTPNVTPTVSGKNVTWSLSNATEFTFKPSTQTRCNGITVVYSAGGSTPAPSISASDVNVAYNATSGSIAYSIDNSVDGGVVSAAVTAGDWLTLGNGTSSPISFTCSANSSMVARTATVTLTYTYNTNQTVTKAVTISQSADPNAVNNISDITAAGNYKVRGTIVAKNQRGFIIGDGTGYVYYYNNTDYTPANYSIGDKVKLDGAVVAYGGVFEFNNTTTVTSATESNYVAEDPTVLTGAQMDTRVASTTPTQLSSFVQYEGVLSVNDTHYNITSIDGASKAQGSISYPISTSFTSLNGKSVKVTGYYVGVSSSTYYNTMIGSVEEITVPVINADGSVELEYNATSGAIDYTISNPTAGVTLTATTSADWISNITVTSDKVTFTTTANEGNEDRTATITLAYAGAENKTVTVTQKHFVAEYATLPFEYDGGKSGIANTAGLSEDGLGSDYNSSPKLKFDGTGDWVLLKLNERPGILSFDIKGNGFSGGIFKVQASTNGETFTDVKTYTEIDGTTSTEKISNLAPDVRYIKWIYTTKSSGNVALGNISLAEYVDLYAVNWTAGENTELFVFAGDESETIENGDKVAEGTTVMVSVDVDQGYHFGSLVVKDANNNELELTEIEPNAYYSFEMPASDVTITSTAEEDAPPTGSKYTLFTGDLVEGDYIIYYDGYAMNNVESGDRLQYVEVTPANNTITTDNAAIVWHIAKSGNYWTIYSADANAYAAGTGAKNKAQMLADGTDDMALWSVSGTETYEFVNKKNAANSVNSNLRKNGTYGFACYSTDTGGALSLYKLVEPAAPDTYTLTLTAGDGGYWGTFFNGVAGYELPDGAQAFTMNADKQLYRLGDDNARGKYIPANTAVVIISDVSEITLTKCESAEPVSPNGGANILQGSDFSVAKTGNQYVLGKKNNVIGFFKFTGTSIPANKAYYVVSE